MYCSKFVVYFLLLIQSLVARNYCNAEHLTPMETDNDSPQKLRSTRHTVKSANEMGLVDLLQIQNDNNQYSKKQRTKSNNSTTTNDSSDDEFKFLVTGGYRPEKNDLVKYVVSIRVVNERKFFGDNHFCGGSIISTKSVLTAAHCLYAGGSKLRANRVKVVVGTPRRLLKTKNTQEIMVEKVRPHPKYSNTHLTNDIGIIKLKEPVRLNSDFASVIPIADRDPKAGLLCTVVGWGTVIQYGPTPDEAVNGDVTINTNAYCSKINGFRKGMLCASNANDYEVDSCQGDSGGPLICGGKVVGVVSFGSGCGEPDSAGVYTDIYYYRDWIGRNAANRLTIQSFHWYRFLLLTTLVTLTYHLNPFI